MIKKAVISAAGKGTRMKHLSKNKPKHMIRVNGKPFLYYLIENLRKAGFEEIIIVVGHKHEYIEDFAGQHPFPLTIVNQYAILGEDLYGTAIPIRAVEKIVGEEPFIAVAGDNLYSPEDLTSLRIDDDYSYVAGIKHEHPEKYGVLLYDNDMKLKKIIEKPKEDVGSTVINTALFKFTPAIFDVIQNVPRQPNGEYYLTDAVTTLAEQGKVKVKILNDYWLDFGNPADVIRLSKFLKNNGS